MTVRPAARGALVQARARATISAPAEATSALVARCAGRTRYLLGDAGLARAIGASCAVAVVRAIRLACGEAASVRRAGRRGGAAAGARSLAITGVVGLLPAGARCCDARRAHRPVVALPAGADAVRAARRLWCRLAEVPRIRRAVRRRSACSVRASRQLAQARDARAVARDIATDTVDAVVARALGAGGAR